jgi:hypothetical protein
MIKIGLVLVATLLIGSCSKGPRLFDQPGDYVGSETASIEIACNKRGSQAKESMAWKMCVQSQKNHYRK